MNMKLRPGKAHVALVLAIREMRDLCTFPHSAQGLSSAQGYVEAPDNEDTYDNYGGLAPESRVVRRAVTRGGLIKPGWPNERRCPPGPSA